MRLANLGLVIVLLAAIGLVVGCGDAKRPPTGSVIPSESHPSPAESAILPPEPPKQIITYQSEAIDDRQTLLYTRAVKAMESGDYATAEDICRDIISQYPEDPDGYESLAVCLEYQEREKEAINEYRKALKLDPDSHDAYYGLGGIAHAQERYKDAQELLERALEIDPDEAFCHLALAVVFDDTDQLADAAKHYRQAIDLDYSIANDGETAARLSEIEEQIGKDSDFEK